MTRDFLLLSRDVRTSWKLTSCLTSMENCSRSSEKHENEKEKKIISMRKLNIKHMSLMTKMNNKIVRWKDKKNIW